MGASIGIGLAWRWRGGVLVYVSKEGMMDATWDNDHARKLNNKQFLKALDKAAGHVASVTTMSRAESHRRIYAAIRAYWAQEIQGFLAH
ncbi:MAG: hypothetical protein GY820_39860 [Gammaproteobacteria bacterium]|nr:hypothetical protein [Gammaproteobacteria bacterium]